MTKFPFKILAKSLKEKGRIRIKDTKLTKIKTYKKINFIAAQKKLYNHQQHHPKPTVSNPSTIILSPTITNPIQQISNQISNKPNQPDSKKSPAINSKPFTTIVDPCNKLNSKP